MRILHTSDWHLGRRFHGHDLLAAQEQVLSGPGGLVAMVEAEQVDVVVIAGDLYDRALPGAEAVALCNRVLARIAATGARIVAIPGNHDSATRLGFGAEFLAAGGLHLHTDPADAGHPVLLRAGGTVVAFYPIPYLEPETARYVLPGTPERSHQAVLTAAMAAVRADLARRPGVRSVVVAHAFVTAGGRPERSDSERSIAVGGVEDVAAGTFDGVDYAALGHLHGVQQPDRDRPWLRYSGSPLAYSFSEHRQHKSALLVDLPVNGPADVRRVPLPVPRRLSLLTGELADLLENPAHEALTGDWIAVTLTDRLRPTDPMRRLQARFPYTATLDWVPPGALPATRPVRPRQPAGDLDVAADFAEYVRGEPLTAAERDLTAAAFTAVAADHFRAEEAGRA